MIAFTIYGEPASKANARRIVTLRGRPAVIKSKKALDYERSALLQVPVMAPLTGDLCFTATIYYASRRPDLDESVLLDVLQARVVNGHLVRRGVYLNDRQIKQKHIFWGLDKQSPRADIMIAPITD